MLAHAERVNYPKDWTQNHIKISVSGFKLAAFFHNRTRSSVKYYFFLYADGDTPSYLRNFAWK